MRKNGEGRHGWLAGWLAVWMAGSFHFSVGTYKGGMSYLSAKQAARLLKRCSFPEKVIIDSLIRKAEYAIRIASSQRQNNVFWTVPVIYSAVPAYNYVFMQKVVGEHLREEGFYVKLFPDGVTMWISWRLACEALDQEEKKK